MYPLLGKWYCYFPSSESKIVKDRHKPIEKIGQTVPDDSAKKELYEHHNPLIRFLVISLGAYSVDRDNPEKATLKTIIDIAKKTKWNLGMFPQGKQILEGEKFNDIKPGFVSIAKLAKMDIVPIAICNFTGYTWIPFTKHITLKIGKPISYELPEEEIVKQWVDYMKENVD